MLTFTTKLAMAMMVGLVIAPASSAQDQMSGAYSRLKTQTIPTALSANDISLGHQQTSWTSPAMRYFGGGRARPIVQRAPRQQMPLPQPVQVARRTKPFSNLQRSSTISPYLALDKLQSGVEVPNYYAYVRPMLQQQQANRTQRANLRRMERQIHAASATGIVTGNTSGGIPTTGHSTQFLNMGEYFPGK